MTPSRILPGILFAIAGAVILALGWVYGVSEWRMRRTHDVALMPLRSSAPPDLLAGKHMARLVGCWAGCHGKEGEGGTVTTQELSRITAPTLSPIIASYSDEELVRLIRYGVKRDGVSAIGMSSYTFWALGDADLRNIIAHLRAQPSRAPVPRHHVLRFRGRVALATGEWKVSADDVDPSRPRWGEMPRRSAFERGRYLASVVCSECHGLDFRGNALQGGPSLVVVAAYQPAQFQHLLRTGKPIGDRDIPDMSWMANVEFTDREITDIYGFLREYHGLGPAR